MICYKADGISRYAIRQYVRKLKRLVGLEYKLYFPVLLFAENILPLMIQNYQFEVVPVEEMGNKHGETYPSKNLIRIREDVYLRASSGEPRDRMTVAHEIGHLFLHENDAVALCRLAPNDKLRTFEDPEWQADAFGGELLASSYLIKNMNRFEVQSSCGVSAAAAYVQLKTIR